MCPYCFHERCHSFFTPRCKDIKDVKDGKDGKDGKDSKDSKDE